MRTDRNRNDTPDTKGETETFLTRNVRLITFLICIAVFLGIFGPLSVFHLVRYFDTLADEATLGTVEMTTDDLVALSKRADVLTEKDFERFVREDGGEWKVGHKTGRMSYISVGDRYQLSCMVETSTRKVVYLTLMDLDSGESFDLLDKKTDIDAILR